MDYQKGNYISTEYGIVKINNVVFDRYHVIGKDGRSLWADKVEPIELTESILIKNGYKRIKKGIGWDEFKGGELVLTEVPTNKGNMIAFNYSTDKYTIIKHVHQWQQIYEALTGTKLQIQL